MFKWYLRMKKILKISLPDIVGRGYKTFWNFKGRYRVCKGSRASKKSKTTALWIPYNIMKYPKANALVIRKTYGTLKNSCYTDIKWAINRLGVSHLWKCTESPLEMTYIPTGQKILFRGLDDPLKITSITVSVGQLCWLWLEEAYEITKEEDFDMLDESIRGATEEGLFKQITITFNPWNEKHWLKKRFFDVEDDDILAITTNYTINEWLDDADRKVFEKMKLNNPRRYQVAGLGNWGVVDGLVYENWSEQEFKLITREDKENGKEGIIVDDLKPVTGLDFGYTNDPSALFVGWLDIDNKKLYVVDEMYQKGMSNKKIYEEIKRKGYIKRKIVCDSAEPKSIDELRGFGVKACSAKKGKDSIMNGIQWIQDLEIIIHPRCVNFLTEISLYTWDKDKFGNTLNRPIDEFNHLMDAMRYALEEYVRKKGWLY